jgi:chloride channel 3/4/5
MSQHPDAANERTRLLYYVTNKRRSSQLQHQDEEARSIISPAVTKDEQHMSGSAVGERLPYNDYTTIDWLHDLVRPAEQICMCACAY